MLQKYLLSLKIMSVKKKLGEGGGGDAILSVASSIQHLATQAVKSHIGNIFSNTII